MLFRKNIVFFLMATACCCCESALFLGLGFGGVFAKNGRKLMVFCGQSVDKCVVNVVKKMVDLRA